MRLSEAMMLGSTTCKLVAGNMQSCALGCALNAIGADWSWRYKAAIRIWPWIGGLNEDGPLWDIVNKFDGEVCKGIMTLEQLVDYVRSIEPDCDCNRFNCDCTKQAATTVDHADWKPAVNARLGVK